MAPWTTQRPDGLVNTARRLLLLLLVPWGLAGCPDAVTSTPPLDANGTTPDLAVSGRVCPAPASGISEYGSVLTGCALIRGNVNLSCPSGLTDLRLLEELQAVEGDLFIEFCTSLRSLAGLERLGRTGSLWLNADPLLPDLSALSGLNLVGDGLVVQEMESLTSLRGLDNLTSAGSVTLQSLPKVPDLAGLPSLQVVTELTIVGNPVLRSLSGLTSLRAIHGRLTIRANPLLPRSEVDAFLARVSVTGGKDIANNGP